MSFLHSNFHFELEDQYRGTGERSGPPFRDLGNDLPLILVRSSGTTLSQNRGLCTMKQVQQDAHRRYCRQLTMHMLACREEGGVVGTMRSRKRDALAQIFLPDIAISLRPTVQV